MSAARSISLAVCLGLLAGCASSLHPDRPQIAAMSLEELRQARRAPIPACARKFTQCQGKVCALRSLRADEAGEWLSCEPQVQRWEAEQLEIRGAILDRDPLPACFDGGKDVYRNAGINPYSVERNLLLLAKGQNLGTLDCTLAHCAWVARNADDVEQLVAVCGKFTAVTQKQ